METALRGVRGGVLLSPSLRSPDDSLVRRARLSGLSLQVLYQRLDVRILDRIGHVHRVTWVRHSEGLRGAGFPSAM
ncbi:MAG TPA: hypothetical protein VNB93_06480 [Rubrobacter sp.]|nr:hypothetical protein [Rubrobacter sp.]